MTYIIYYVKINIINKNMLNGGQCRCYLHLSYEFSTITLIGAFNMVGFKSPIFVLDLSQLFFVPFFLLSCLLLFFLAFWLN